MENLKNYLFKKADAKHLLICGILFIMFNIVIFPYLQNRIDPTGQHSMLDLLFGYSIHEAYYILDAIGEEGRLAHLIATSAADMIYPPVYALFLSLIIAVMMKKLKLTDGILSFLVFFPFLIMAFDFMENSAIIIMLSSFPYLPEWAVMTGSYAGMAKWVSTAIVILIILIPGVRIFINKIFKLK